MDPEIIELLKNISELNTNKLIRKNKDFEFTDISQKLDAIIQFSANALENKIFLEQLPDNQKEDLSEIIRNIANSMNQITEFNPGETTNPQEIRNQYASQIVTSYQQLFNYINQLDLFILKTSGNQATLSEITAESKRILSNMRRRQKNVEEIEKSSRKTASSVPLYKYLGIFEEQSLAHKNASYSWLGFTIVFTGLSVYLLNNVSGEFATKMIDLDSTQKIYAFLIIKLFFLAIVFFILQQTTRNYLAHTHLSVVNKQRENSLKVFNAMIKNSDNKDITDQILLYLSQSIFFASETGFYPGKSGEKEGPDVVSIVKDISKGKG